MFLLDHGYFDVLGKKFLYDMPLNTFSFGTVKLTMKLRIHVSGAEEGIRKISPTGVKCSFCHFCVTRRFRFRKYKKDCDVICE